MNERRFSKRATLAGCLTGLIVLTASGLTLAHQDPCNFNDGSEVFSYEQVMSCYESVPFDPLDLANAVEFLSAARERSDLREVFQEKYQWREELDALAGQSFDNDHDFQLALVDNHKKFFNPHWQYQRPYCYTLFLSAFIPFDFGSTVVTVPGRGAPEQIIFIESAPFLADLYQSYTGIDAHAHVGARVVSINGVPALDYFREFAANVYRFDENPGQGLNEVLQNAAYSLRVSFTHDVPPDRSYDVLVLETRTGRRETVEIPWVFATRETLGIFQWPLELSSSTEDFHQICLQPSIVEAFYGGASAGLTLDVSTESVNGMVQSATEFSREIAEKRNLVARLNREYRGPRASYFELPPGQRAQQVSVIVPSNAGAVAYQLSGRATVIRLDDFMQDWKDEVIAATTHACEHSDRLIFDMRNNSGGFIDQIRWLVTHLLPSRAPMLDGSMVGRFLNSDPGRNELVQRMEQVKLMFGIAGQCLWGYEADCVLDPETEEVLTDPDWYLFPEYEERGGKLESLTREVVFRSSRVRYSGVDPIACPGKFEGTNLAIFSNGTGLSAGYFWPALMRPDATIVTAGGFVSEPLVFGVARGGAVWGMNNFEALLEQDLATFFGPAAEPLPFFRRDVDSFIEQPGSYMRGSTTDLFINDPALGDLHIDVWSDSPESNGFVYGRVLQALQSAESRSRRR